MIENGSDLRLHDAIICEKSRNRRDGGVNQSALCAVSIDFVKVSAFAIDREDRTTMSNEHKVALITGAGTGIGKASAKTLAKAGYALVLAGRRKEPLEAVKKEIEGTGGKAIVFACDVGKPDQVKTLFAETKNAFGRLDVLFNNAGIGAPPVPLED